MTHHVTQARATSQSLVDSTKRDSLRKVGHVVIATAVLPSIGLLMPRPAKAALWIVPSIAFLLGYGFERLWGALHRSDQRYGQERLRDRMAGFDFPTRSDASSLGLYLGSSNANTDLVSRLHWTEWGYHDAKSKEGAPYRHPVSPREGLDYTDKQIFEAALGRRTAGLMRNGEAYARDYRDRQGNALRIVAGRLPDGQTYVAESDGRNATAYEITASRG